jgi:ABC-type multidrug transport system fused ATPase/permease subunit
MSNWVDTAESHLEKSTAYYLGIYVLLSLVSTLSDGMTYLTFMRGSWVASKRLHAELVSAITHTSLFWLEKTSIGKIMNRLSDDIDTLDQSISEPLKDFLDELFKAMLMLGAVSGIIPLILAPVFLLSMIGIYVGDIYSRAIAEVKNLVSSAQAPVTSRLAETVEGAMVIRARNGVQPILDKKIYHLLYTSVKTAAVQRDCDQWLRFRLNSLAAIMNVLAGICALYTTGSISAGLVGFSLSQASSMSQGILRLIFKLNDLNASMLSVRCFVCFFLLLPNIVG